MLNKKEFFVINGLANKKTLKGSVRINGAKNAVLKALASTILFRDDITLKNVPDIEDVGRMIDLLSSLGCNISKKKTGVFVCKYCKKISHILNPEISSKLRASIVVAGPLLARLGKVSFPHPGGCVIGERPIDLFIDGFKKMGAKVQLKRSMYTLTAQNGKLKGADIFFRTQSVTGTETFMMAGVLAEGKTIIKNAALEPEIKHLADFLNLCGAKIKGAGTSTIEITGGKLLTSGNNKYTTPPDRIEAGSFIILGALAASDIKITNCDTSGLESLLEILKASGLSFKTTKSTLHIFNNKKDNSNFKNIDRIKTHEYPGFPTDLQAPMVIFLTQASGECLMFETIFEGRLNYTEELVRMGADIKEMDPHRIIVSGHKSLRGKELASPDLRAGLAYVIAAIIADGRSIIHNIYNIDRGYQHIEKRLRDLGVDIKRVSE